MTVENSYTRTLQRAAQVLGGFDALAAELRVSISDLVGWLNGSVVLPVPLYLKALDIVAAGGSRRTSGNV